MSSNAISTSLYRIKPQGFSPFVEVASCYLEHEGKLLWLKRAADKPQGDTWGVPAGKLESCELPLEAVIRETLEETGIRLDKKHLHPISSLYARHLKGDFIYHMFHYKCPDRPEVFLSDEHQDFQWVSFEEAFTLPLIGGGAEALHHFKALSKKPSLPRKPFYFIRHGETDINANPNVKRVDYDLPLNLKGRNQARFAREIVTTLPLSAVCCSPIQRAQETKSLLLDGLSIPQHDISELGECQASVWTNMVKLEQGEGYHVCEEVNAFLFQALSGTFQALENHETPLVVSHGGVHWALCYLMQIENHPWKIGNCQVVHFTPKESHKWEARIVKK